MGARWRRVGNKTRPGSHVGVKVLNLVGFTHTHPHTLRKRFGTRVGCGKLWKNMFSMFLLHSALVGTAWRVILTSLLNDVGSKREQPWVSVATCWRQDGSQEHQVEPHDQKQVPPLIWRPIDARTRGVGLHTKNSCQKR